MFITQLAKNKEGTGLHNIVSFLYRTKETNQKVNIEFETNQGVKSLNLAWTIQGGKRGYTYTIPKSVSKKNIDENVFFTKQDQVLPSITLTLLAMGFKDKTLASVKDKRDNTQIKDLFKEDLVSEEQIDDFDFDEIDEKIKEKKTWKLGTLEILHKLFNTPNQSVAWPKEITYKAVGAKKKEIVNKNIKTVHKYKKLFGETLVDSPIQELVNFKISSSTFNVGATGVIPIVVESKDGELVEAKQYKNRVLVSNGLVRVGYLYATLTKEIFDQFINEKILEPQSYSIGKYYKIPLENARNGESISLVNKKIKSIPKEEIVNLAYEIEELKIKQTIYNSKIKELNTKLNPVDNVLKPEYQLENESLGINSKGEFVTEQEEDQTATKNIKITNNVAISVLKFPKKIEIGKEKEILENYIKLEGDINLISLDKLLLLRDDLIEKVKNIKKSLEENRYKMALISNTYFLNGFSPELEYKIGDNGKDITIEKTKAAGIVGGEKQSKVITSKDGMINVRIQLFKKETTV